ncbi:hypothetical protein [Bacteroides sp.]|uniref:hypothetical protein n=1 Tax=Bacteroides sp. TaxID=29523 RepID=UPI00263803C7|nr:hypothetical protein [Bacteroides sp.]MDD3039072.1 hypothetical protein [Bacteroides sp.]
MTDNSNNAFPQHDQIVSTQILFGILILLIIGVMGVNLYYFAQPSGELQRATIYDKQINDALCIVETNYGVYAVDTKVYIYLQIGQTYDLELRYNHVVMMDIITKITKQY